jgi:hypothetical protein
MMAQYNGKIEGREGSNILACGKQFYVPPEKVWLFEKYPAGSSVTLKEVKGTVSMIMPLNGTSSEPVPAIKPAGKAESTQTSPTATAVTSLSVKEAPKDIPAASRQVNGFKDSDRIGWQALLNTAVNIANPSWRDDPDKTVHENVSARLELVKSTASGLHVFITEKLDGCGGCSCQK